MYIYDGIYESSCIFVVDKKSESVVMSPSLRSDKVSEMTDPPSSITTTTPLEILDTSYVWLTVDKP